MKVNKKPHEQNVSRRDRILGALWGSAVGDALGVPVEFRNREELRMSPVTGMRANGTHHQPAGAWLDDTSLTLCTIDSLLHGFDPVDMGKTLSGLVSGRSLDTAWRFRCRQHNQHRLESNEAGVAAESAGSKGIESNGNGSLMRILPIALWFMQGPKEEMLESAHRVSAITHGHARSLLACGFFCLMMREILDGQTAADAYGLALDSFQTFYSEGPHNLSLKHFGKLLDGNLSGKSEEEISSTGYVMDTLTASVWCTLTSTTFEEAVLKAVNLGCDTDTTGTVTGALSGAIHGVNAVPLKWREVLARQDELNQIYESFCKLLEQ